jgi:hypothetical protein
MMLVCIVVQQILSNVFRLMQQFVLWNAANLRKNAVDLMYAVIKMTFVVLALAVAARLVQLVVVNLHVVPQVSCVVLILGNVLQQVVVAVTQIVQLTRNVVLIDVFLPISVAVKKLK